MSHHTSIEPMLQALQNLADVLQFWVYVGLFAYVVVLAAILACRKETL